MSEGGLPDLQIAHVIFTAFLLWGEGRGVTGREHVGDEMYTLTK